MRRPPGVGAPPAGACVHPLQAQLLERIRSSPTVLAAAAGNASKAALLAHAAHDATALAGALSAPNIISRALWLLYNSSDAPITPPLLLDDPLLADP